jgi:ABC-type bacteriocin/lantibiotic exporter with double-glycine peptidase domain
MIAHRRSTLDGCERIIRVDRGVVSEETRPKRRGAA